MNRAASPIVLVHGAFRGGWAWTKVKPILEARGLLVFSPSLKGAGERASELNGDITLDDWASEIAGLICDQHLDNCVLVGHSQGGIVVQAAAELCFERLSRLVFLDAPVLADGEAAIDLTPEDSLAKFGRPLADTLVQPAPVQPGDQYSPEEAAWINARLTASPVNPGLNSVTFKRAARLPQSVIFCAQTPAFFPAAFSRARFDAEQRPYTLIEAPHDCIWTHAGRIADLILDGSTDPA